VALAGNGRRRAVHVRGRRYNAPASLDHRTRTGNSSHRRAGIGATCSSTVGYRQSALLTPSGSRSGVIPQHLPRPNLDSQPAPRSPKTRVGEVELAAAAAAGVPRSPRCAPLAEQQESDDGRRGA
jgi:hypothetical protein